MNSQIQNFYLVRFLFILMKNNSRNSLAPKLFKIFNILILGLCFIAEVFAASGDIDRSFGIDGFSKLSIGSSNQVSKSVIQPDGKIVVVGSTKNGLFKDFFVARFNSNGIPDNTFGGDGKVITSVSNLDDIALSVVLQPDGKIILVGASTIAVPNGRTESVIIRYNTDGSLDTSFDGDGIIVTQISNSSVFGFDAAVLPDGKILVSGHITTVESSPFAIFRYNPDGSVDTTFGANGRVVTLLSGFPFSLQNLAVQKDGKILLAGGSSLDRFSSRVQFAVVRLNPDGILDSSFGNNGVVTTKINSSAEDGDAILAILIQSDNKIVVAGYSHSGTNTKVDFAAARYNPNGSLDSTFDGDGKVMISFGENSDAALAVALQADGKLILAGSSNLNSALVRLNTNGSLDSTFGDNGKIITPVPPGNSEITDVNIQSDGKIVAVGRSYDAANSSFTNVFLVRYQANGGKVGDFDGDGKSDISVFRPSDGYWYIHKSSGGYTFIQWGISTDTPVPGDYDGDGKTDVAVHRKSIASPSSGIWYVLRSSDNAFNARRWASNNLGEFDTPIPADYDNDGKTDLAYYRITDVVGQPGRFFILRSSTDSGVSMDWGNPSLGDKPIPADYDGDGKADYAVFRNGTWFILQSSDNQIRIEYFGLSSDKLVPADFDGDGKADIAVWRPSNGYWYWISSKDKSFNSIQFGLSDDKPVPGDYDGDGKTDVAVYRPSNGVWYLLRSRDGFTAQQFGLPDDVPIPNVFVR